MGKKIFSSGNYVIYQDDDRTLEFAKGYTVYSFNETSEIFTVRETVGGSFEVSVAELINNMVEDNTTTVYDVNTFTTFLRENTGFKTAPGGSGAAPIGATVLKSGQETSYRSGDDGTTEAGRAVDLLTLPGNNPYGNTKRFLDEFGTEIYANNIVIDWSTYDASTSTVLGYENVQHGPGESWVSAVDSALNIFDIGGFTGWRLPNVREMLNILHYGLATHNLNYGPFAVLGTGNYWTGTTNPIVTTQAYARSVSGVGPIAKTTTSNMNWFAVRTFTVTGTTLS